MQRGIFEKIKKTVKYTIVLLLVFVFGFSNFVSVLPSVFQNNRLAESFRVETVQAAAPTFVAAGAVAANAAAITPGLPAGIATGDILLLFLETSNQAITIANSNGGTWTEVTSSPQGVGTGGNNTSTRLTVFWSRYNGTQGAPTTSDSGNSQLGRMIAVRGAFSSGDPIDITSGGTDAVADKTGVIPGATTTVVDTFVVVAEGTALPKSTGTAGFSLWTNADLANLTERIDNTTNVSNGGGLGVATGNKATIGAYGSTTVANSVNSVKVMMSIAIKPNPPPVLSISQPPSGNTEVAHGSSYNITYSLSDLDDTVTAAFYYDTNSDGIGGTAITGACATVAEGTNATCAFNTSVLTTGTPYYIYGVSNDGFNPAVTTVSSGTITVNAVPTFSISQPDGVNDKIVQNASYNIAYSLADPDNAVTAVFYYDTNNSGLDGVAITGVCATAAEGSGVTCSWNTAGVASGSYYVYGITSDGINSQVSAYSSGTMTINSPPVMTAVTITPDPAYKSTPFLTANPSATDADSDTIIYSYQWKKGGADIIGETNSTLSNTNYVKGDSITVTVTPNDGTTNGTSMTSSALVISNTAPVMTAVTITPDPAYKSTAFLTANPSATDADSDTIIYTYQWKKGGIDIVGQTASTLFNANFNKGDSISVSVTPDDGAVNGLSMVSNALVISNTAPVMSSVTIVPDPAYKTTAFLTANPSATDVDSDTITYSYQWKKGGLNIAGQIFSTLSNSHYAKGDSITVTVTPNDGTNNGSSMTSSALVIGNSAPVMTSVTITPDPAYKTTATLTANPSATDADSDTITYAYQWKKGGVNISGETFSTLSNTHYVKGNSITVEVTPNDGTVDGTPMTSGALVISNSAPVMTSVTITPDPAYKSTLNLTANPSATDADSDSITYSYQWKKGGVNISGETGATLSNTNYVKGNSITVAVTPNDGATNGTPMTSGALVISNTAPTQPTVSVTDPSYDSTNIVCSPSGSTDIDSDTITYLYAWYKDTVLQPSRTTNTVNASYTSVGEVWKCVATPNDGTDNGPSGEASVTVQADLDLTAPAAVSDLAASNPTSSTIDLTWTAPGDDGSVGTATSYDIRYSTSAITEGNWISATAVSGEPASLVAGTSQSMTVSGLTTGVTYYFAMKTSDEVPNTSILSNVVSKRTNTAPVMTSVTITPDPAYKSTATLTANPSATDIDSDTITYSYQWKKGGLNIAGETSSTLTNTHYNKGDSITVTVTPNDGTVNGTSMTSSALVISNTAPVMTSVTITPDPAYKSTAFLTANPSATDADSDTIAYSYQWKKGGSNIAGETSSTLSNTNYIKGDSITVTVTPNDGTDNGSSMTSSALVISNTAPVMTAVTITPDPANSATPFLTANPSATDADSDTITYVYQWRKGGVNINGETSSTLSNFNYTTGDSITVRVTPNDGTTNGTPMTSSALVISNTSPVMTSVTITPDPAYKSTAFLTANPSATDADSDMIAYSYQWKKGGINISGATASTLSNTHYVKGDSITVEVTPNDGMTNGAPMTSAALVISNSIPVMTAVTITPDPAYKSTPFLTANPSATDADSDTIIYSYQWKKGGADIIGETNSTLSNTNYVKGDSITVSVAPSDGAVTGLAITSSALAISNSAPTQPAVSVTSPALDSTNLVCTPSGSTDADSDTITYAYAWYKDTVLQGSLTTDTVDASNTSTGEVWKCVITPNDGTVNGATGEASVTIQAVLDTTAPAAITDLTASNPTDFSIDLAWISPGDDGSVGTATSYDIRYSTANITDANWASATSVSGEPSPLVAGTSQSKTISGLLSSTTYYFAMKTSDEVPNTSALSNVASLATSATADTTAPSAISTLAASNPTGSTIDLAWIAPGNDALVGTATSYDIRYSTSDITDANWASATLVSGEPSPLAAGSSQSMAVTGLIAETTYYFAMKTSDSAPNISALSNVASLATVAASVTPVPTPARRLIENIPVTVRFSGQAYPASMIEIMRKSAQDLTFQNIPTGPALVRDDGTFEINFIGLLKRDYIYALLVQDKDGRKTTMLYDVDLLAQNSFEVKDIFVPPTIELKNTLLMQSDDLSIVGYAAADNIIRVEIDGALQDTITYADKSGYYIFNISAGPFTTGVHYVRVKQSNNRGDESMFSQTKVFRRSILQVRKADTNNDGKVNVTDWSIFLYRWNSTDPALRATLDMDGNGKIDVLDLSIFLKALQN